MPQYSFTGTRALKSEHKSVINHVLGILKDGVVFNTGGAYGVDTYVAKTLAALFPNTSRRIIVPDAPYNVETLKYGVPFYMPTIIGDEPYRKRNEFLVSICDVLIAFPKTAKEVQRSGTWMTIRMARKAGKETRIFPLEGE